MSHHKLSTYRRVASGVRLPRFVQAAWRKVDIADLSELSLEELWAQHDECRAVGRKRPSVSLLDVKAALAARMLENCALCDRRCGVNRTKGERGFCNVGSESNFFFNDILYGEELPLVPSHEVFLSGCNMRCKYCYSWKSVLDTSQGCKLIHEDFAHTVKQFKSEGAINLNLIGGEATVHLPNILEMLKHVSCRTPIVWNSNFFMSEETMRLLDGIVDLYVGDFRFGNDTCARELGGVDRYFTAAARNFQTAANESDLIIRHLVVPGHVECCLAPIAQWVANNLPDTPFNLMFQYAPYHEAEGDPMIGRTLSASEEKLAHEIVSDLKLNTEVWNRPITGAAKKPSHRDHELETTITIRPDGRVAIARMYGELLPIVEVLEAGDSRILTHF